jgi:hypothetical protein
MRKNIDGRFALFRKVFHDRKRDSYAAYANRDFEDLARLQLKCGLTEAAWATVTEWNGIIREQQGLWGYVPRDIGELLKDSAFAPLRERLRRLLEENAKRGRNEEESPDETG